MIRIFYRAESPDFPRSALVQIRLDNVLVRCKRRRKRDKITGGYTHLFRTLDIIKNARILVFGFVEVLKETFELISEHFRGSNVRT